MYIITNNSKCKYYNDQTSNNISNYKAKDNFTNNVSL